MNGYYFITFVDSKETYVYQDGIYKKNGEALIDGECKKRLRDRYRKNRVSEVIAYVKAATYEERKEEPPHLLAVQNCILNLETEQMVPPKI